VKTLYCLLAVVVLTLAACGGDDDDNRDDPNANQLGACRYTQNVGTYEGKERCVASESKANCEGRMRFPQHNPNQSCSDMGFTFCCDLNGGPNSSCFGDKDMCVNLCDDAFGNDPATTCQG